MNQKAAKLKAGDLVVLNPGSYFKLKGELRQIKPCDPGNYLITIYSFFYRKEFEFLIDDHFAIVRSFDDKDIPVAYNLSGKQRFFCQPNRSVFYQIIALFILLIFIYQINPYLNLFKPNVAYTYQQFLNRDFSLNKLYTIVNARLTYRPDQSDFWIPPDLAWLNREGDCEEFSSVVAGYLTHQKIENYMVGLFSPHSSTGHVVVFLNYNGFFYVIDPTRAVESQGVVKLDKVNTLKEAVGLYTRLPAYIYKIPAYLGEKKVVKRIN